jgi:hypothetical protein
MTDLCYSTATQPTRNMLQQVRIPGKGKIYSASEMAHPLQQALSRPEVH